MRFLVLFFMLFIGAQATYANCTLSIEMRDAIGPASYDYLQRAQAKAKELQCTSILMKINTPGGSLQSTRLIVENIMGSEIPILCLVHPSGGHAGSAGAIIMQACHVNGMMEATNIGAASPVSGSGQEIPDDLRKKLFQDTRSFVEGLAKYRGRSLKFAKDIVDDAKALDAQSALKEGAIDVVVSNINEFLDFSKKQQVRLDSEEKSQVIIGEIKVFNPDLRHDVMQIFSNPQWAYLIFMGSLGLLYFELTHPGGLFPGVVGAIGLVISLMNFHMLDVSWGGVALILLGVAFMFAEMFVPSFGALGLGGIASFIVGSLFLFPEGSGYEIPLSLLLATSIFLSFLMFGISYLAIKAMRHGQENQKKDAMPGKTLVVKSFNSTSGEGIGLIHGELWKFKSQDVLNIGDEAEITKVNGLTIYVKKTEGEV